MTAFLEWALKFLFCCVIAIPYCILLNVLFRKNGVDLLLGRKTD